MICLFIPPQLFEIGYDKIFKIVNHTDINVVEKPVYAANVSLQSTLQKFFSVPGVFEQVQEYTKKLSAEKHMYLT